GARRELFVRGVETDRGHGRLSFCEPAGGRAGPCQAPRSPYRFPVAAPLAGHAGTNPRTGGGEGRPGRSALAVARGQYLGGDLVDLVDLGVGERALPFGDPAPGPAA